MVNEDYSLNGQNMIIAYNSPVKDITVIGKPFNWGFFFLGRDRGLSFYWAMKLVVMVLLGFEVRKSLNYQTPLDLFLSYVNGKFCLASSDK
ncbi:hypothetical protein EfmAA610_09690 [Enterococcus faecium]|nr:hypothetical protein EfmAA610_09690 [Enterococcus faecium]